MPERRVALRFPSDLAERLDDFVAHEVEATGYNVTVSDVVRKLVTEGLDREDRAEKVAAWRKRQGRGGKPAKGGAR